MRTYKIVKKIKKYGIKKYNQAISCNCSSKELYGSPFL